MNHLAKLQQKIFLVIVFLLPTQLGLHFWPSWAFINGLRVDYFSPTLYLTDILVLILFLTHGVALFAIRNNKKTRKYFLFAFCIFLFAFINVWFSLSPFVSIYKWFKLLEVAFLGWWLKENWSLKNSALFVWFLASLLQSFLAFGQLLFQHSFGGAIYFLGERNLSLESPGAATIFINASQTLRPYGSFSHPNVLAGYLLTSLILGAVNLRYLCGKYGKPIIIGTVVAIQIALLSTLSLTAIFTEFVIICYLFRHRLPIKTLFVSLIFILLLIYPKISTANFFIESILPRQQLFFPAWQAFVDRPVWGQGLGVSPEISARGLLKLENLALFFQPVHNLLVLILAETGVVGLFGAIFLFSKAWQNRVFSQIGGPLLLCLGFLSQFDHYFLTSQQGLFLLAVVFGLAFQRTRHTMSS